MRGAMRVMAVLSMGLLAGFLSACGQSEPDAGHASAPGSEMAGHGHDHEHGPGEDHDHEDDMTHGRDSDVDLGEMQIGGHLFRVVQSHGMAEPGKELHITIQSVANGSAEWSLNGATLRVWIGTSERLNSLVALAESGSDQNRFDAHVIVPDPQPEDAQWWFEFETADGEKFVGSQRLN